MDFIEMWEQADIADAEIGGWDSIPEWEKRDYTEACLIALADDFKVGNMDKLKRQTNIRRER